jgi:hypothetical protein
MKRIPYSLGLFLLVCLVLLGLWQSPAASAGTRWAVLLPAEAGQGIVKSHPGSTCRFTQFGDVSVVLCDDSLLPTIGKKHPQATSLALQPGEEAWLLSTKDPAVRDLEFPGVRILLRQFGHRVIIANETARMGLARYLSDFTTLEPLPANTVVVTPIRHPDPPSRRDFQHPIASFAAGLDREAYARDLKALVDFQTRYTYSPKIELALDYCSERFSEIGLTAQRQPFGSSGAPRHNLIAVQPGFDAERAGEVIVIGHLDSTSPQASTLAPGADDNGSGAAGVLALARLFQGTRARATIRYVLVVGEEQGLLGSKAFVAALSQAELANIRTVINLDMIGFDVKPPLSMLIETGSFVKEQAEQMADLAARFTTLATQISYRPFGSDHMPFINKRVPAILTIESEFDSNPTYHKVTDTFDRVNLDLCEQILRLDAIFLAQMAGLER